MPDTVIDLLRHGAVEGGRRYRGQLDDPLSETGWEQLRAAVARAATDWDRIVSSPLVRCLAFAQALAEERSIPLEVDARLKEVGFGAWQGYTKAELEEREPGCIARFFADPIGARPPGAEPLDAFFARVHAAWDDLVRAHAGKRVLVVTHAGVMRALLCGLLGIPATSMYRLSIANAARVRVRLREGLGPAVEFGD